MLSISFSGLTAGNTTNQRGVHLPDFADYNRHGPNLLQAIFVSVNTCQLPVLLAMLRATSCLSRRSLDVACNLNVEGHHSPTSRLCVLATRTQQNKTCMHVTLHLLLTWAGFVLGYPGCRLAMTEFKVPIQPVDCSAAATETFASANAACVQIVPNQTYMPSLTFVSIGPDYGNYEECTCNAGYKRNTSTYAGEQGQYL